MIPTLKTAMRELISRSGRMRELATENGTVMLDWVDAVERLLADPAGPESVEAEARAISDRGIRHIIWAGMGGSVLTVRVLVEMGFVGDGADGIAIHPLDSTDPAALNRIVEALAAGKGLAVGEVAGNPAALRLLLSDVLMVGVAMGMTSEEPITHLEWFAGLLAEAGLDPARHLLVMALPGSFLEQFAREHAAPSFPLQLDGGRGTPGRFSAPATRVFLLPAALYLTRYGKSGLLRQVLADAWARHDLHGAVENPSHRFVLLSKKLSEAASDGVCLLKALPPEGWAPLLPWIEQLLEESLGKGGKGVVVFEGEVTGNVSLVARGTWFGAARPPSITPGDASGAIDGLAQLASRFLGWQLTTALYGYLNGITFAGQPAVENYKARARELRSHPAPLEEAVARFPRVEAGGLTLLVPPGVEIAGGSPASVLAAALREADQWLAYLDMTLNGEPTAAWEPVWHAARELARDRLGVPIKIRRAPAAYHSTEQSEMDGPPGILSLRIITRRHEAPLLGRYDDRFLQAQAVATWQAMTEVGRACFLLVVDGDAEQAAGPTLRLVEELNASLAPHG